MNGKLSPLQAEEGENVARIQQFNAAKWERHMQKRPRPKYRVGDIVRVVERRPYQRGYNPSYSQQLYRVIQVFANLALPRYKLIAADNSQTAPLFYRYLETDMVRVTQPPLFATQSPPASPPSSGRLS